MRHASDEREHRRGLVLGLTMAEVLLLLLFLLLLALGGRLATQAKDLAKANGVIETLEPLLKSLAGGNDVTPATIRSLAEDLAAVPQLRRENASLKLALAETAKRDATFKQLEARAREIDPDDPPAALKRGLEVLASQARRQGPDAQARSEMLSRIEKAAREIDPSGQPEATINSALTSLQNARQAGSDAKMGGQIRERVAVLRETEQQINQRLSSTFGPRLKDWGAELDPGSLTLRFQKESVLFDVGSTTLKPAFKGILNDLFPEYIRILYEFRNDLEEVRIEGHTSSEWSSQTGEVQAYFLNMGLSQNRTRAVLEYGLTETHLPPSLAEWARKLITANGLSSSRPRGAAGVEDKDASRRVEFRVLTRAKEQLLKIVDPGPR